MKKKMGSLFMAGVIAAAMLSGCAGAESESADTEESAEAESAETAEQDTATESSNDISQKKIGICIYQFDDNFMSLYRDELVNYLVDQGFSEENITVEDSELSQEKQNQQIQTMIDNGVDVLIINAVNTSEAAGITDMAVGAGIPLVYINREPDVAEEQRWVDNGWEVTYVGCDARQSGTLQGNIIVDIGLEKVDQNDDNIVQYIMIEGDPENIDAQYRTQFSVKALEDQGWSVKCLYDEVGNWDRESAKQLSKEALEKHPETEVVFCNNDSMALGALESINEAGRTVGEDIYLVGVDALTEALDDVIDGSITGTVFNDYFDQSHRAAAATINYMKGAGNDHYIGCDYVMVTKDNAQEILDRIK
ncbi:MULTISPECIES: substrate-binding domain-containing protein [unclassified Butyrivibrio]|uniref:substrate-binding domain-containing protein n=1 Tax=unclassified Butyrivibrio TaxID=2639466 RepID=UPI00040C7938|nr:MULTISPECIES: substrate-binding domain-containing protein [unclassified Butyrivibrio]